MQVIPFRRCDAAIPGIVRAETEADASERVRIQRSTLASEGWYKTAARATRSQARQAGGSYEEFAST